MIRSVLLILLCGLPLSAADWIHWRGPEQAGRSAVQGLPATFGVREVGKEHLLWKTDIGGRSTPLIMDGKLFLIAAGDGEGVMEHERVVCMNADTGKLIWQKKFPVFHTDIVSSRLGWTTLTADPEAKTIFCHGSQGNVFCFDAATGDIKWEHNLTEEFGRITGYGGRIVSPIFDSGLCIVGVINSSWGNHTRGANRFVAFDGKDGHVVWWAEFPAPMKGTYYSSPVITTIKGVRQMITGGGDGAVHGVNVRTGAEVWSYPYSAGVVNPSPIVDGTKVFISHGEQNPEGGPLGRVICVDAAQVDEKTKRPKLLWEVKNLSKRFGLATSALADGVLYVPDDAAELTAFDAANGNVLWKHKYGTVSRGAPLVADGKLYIFDVNGGLTVLELKGKKKPVELQRITFKPKSGTGFLETHGTCIAVNGRLYFCTREATYCIGSKEIPPQGGTTVKSDEKPAGPAVDLRIQPADVATHPGQTVEFRIEFLDASGHVVPAPADAKVEWSLPVPPLPPGATAPPPALKGEVKASGLTAAVTLEKIPPVQQGYIQAKSGAMTSLLARVRVAATIPFTTDFERPPEGAPPAGFVNGGGKYIIKKVGENKVLSKINTDSRPPFARASAYITLPASKDYVIECDVMGTEVRSKFPDMGIINSRYNLVLDGKNDSAHNEKRTLRIVAWEALPRINHAIEYDWQPGQWYRLKLALQLGGNATKVLGKVWKQGDAEPEKWSIEYNDPNPYTNGAAGLYGYVYNMLDTEKQTPTGSVKEIQPGSDIYYDNLSITPAKK